MLPEALTYSPYIRQVVLNEVDRDTDKKSDKTLIIDSVAQRQAAGSESRMKSHHVGLQQLDVLRTLSETAWPKVKESHGQDISTYSATEKRGTHSGETRFAYH